MGFRPPEGLGWYFDIYGERKSNIPYINSYGTYSNNIDNSISQPGQLEDAIIISRPTSKSYEINIHSTMPYIPT